MTAVDDLWYLGDVASQAAERTYHELADSHEDYVEFTRHRSVPRPRFRTVAERVRDNGLPYGAHTVVYRPSGELLLVYHDDVGMWVLPGGEVDGDDSFRAAARRELREEAGVDADYEGLGILGRAVFHCDGRETWGVLPIYEARARSTDLEADDPDGEISEARWFDELPEETRDREQLLEWRERRLE
ncbi:NUDIX hydrolase [Halomicrobium salinisoli]|uniref:NUDIX hydrolase n=1 Tax=Halomicrobium salinisoli TaxID=2878391 RepID=UPI001CF0449E|nr:NUDIX domain-containing protein [Halomicrobium salinisoli]